MPMDDDGEAVPRAASNHETLNRIADMLGCSVEALIEEARDQTNVKDLSELLTIWVEVDDDADRAKLLEFARALSKGDRLAPQVPPQPSPDDWP